MKIGFTKKIDFNCLDFSNIIFNQTPCDKSSGNSLRISVKNIYDLYSIFGGFETDEISFGKNIRFKENAEFIKTVYFAAPDLIVFRSADEINNVKLSDYISNHSWNFTNNITFKNITVTENANFNGANNINVDNNTTLESYVKTKAAEFGKFDVKVYDKLPEKGERGIIYLIPDTDKKYLEYIWLSEDNKFEMIGSTGMVLDQAIRKNENNTLPNYGDSSVFTNKPGVMFGGKFYAFDILESSDGLTNEKLDEKYVKLTENNILPAGEVGLYFNGKFYSFESLCNKEFSNIEYDVNGEQIEKIENLQVYTCSTTVSSIRITPSKEKYVILDAICIDKNKNLWAEIDYVEREQGDDNKIGVIMSFNSESIKSSAWVAIKSIDIETGNIYDTAIFLRNDNSIPVPSSTITNNFVYKFNGQQYFTELIESDLIIKITNQVNKLYITHNNFIILDINLISSNGLSSINGFSNNILEMNIDNIKSGDDWVCLKVLNEADGNVFYRSIKITK